MAVLEPQVVVLKFIAENLAVKFSDLAKCYKQQFVHHNEVELKNLVAEAAKSGLVKIRDEEGEDPIVSITADGSKKADSLSGAAAAVTRLASMI